MNILALNRMRKFEFSMIVIFLMFSLAACGFTSEQPNGEGNIQVESGTSDAVFADTKETLPAQSNAPDTELENGGDVAVILNMNGTDIHAHLYDNTAAKSFVDMLPYAVTVSRAADDLCGTVSEELVHNPAEDQDTWAIGEIGWLDGWFTILCDNEEGMRKRSRTIIGRVNEEDIPVMQAMTGRVEIKITLHID